MRAKAATFSADTRAGDDAIDRAHLRERTLAGVVGNLTPAPFIVLPFVLLIGSLTERDVDAARLGWWVVAAVVSTAITLAVLFAALRHPQERPVPVWLEAAVGLAFASIGIVFGMSTWVASRSIPEVTVLYTLFPCTAAAVGVIVCAGRRDVFLAYLVPLAGTNVIGLLDTGNERIRSLAIVALPFGAALLVLHHVIGRTTIDAITLQWRSARLLHQLDHDRAELTSVNEQLAQTNSRLSHQASHDLLTGLHNRRGTLDELDRMLLDATERHPIGLLFIDLDRFKSVNDTLGHRGGDRYLTVIADRLARSIEAGGLAGRMGGDEFVVLLPGLDQAATLAVANRLVGVLGQPVHAEGRELPSGVSIGVASAPDHGTTSSQLLRHANAALYRAKAAGRNRVELFDGAMQRELLVQVESEQALRRAIDDGEIMPYLQPEIDATSGQIVGAELLARWVRRDGTVVAAHDFMAIASQAGLAPRITDRVITAARPLIRRLAMLGLPDGFRFRINLAPESTERTWRDNPIDVLSQGIDPALLTVDVREAAVTADLPSAAANLAAFRARGGRVCLDDFARGVSSLSLLRRLPLDEVRIDRSSIDTITAHPHDRAIVRSIISLVREIGLAVTAEGIETGAQADALIALGCVRHQGHLYAPALPALQFENFLLERLAERYAGEAVQAATWETRELS
jgi:diguanylate cyclase (GGDEF)-like protein